MELAGLEPATSWVRCWRSVARKTAYLSRSSRTIRYPQQLPQQSGARSPVGQRRLSSKEWSDDVHGRGSRGDFYCRARTRRLGQLALDVPPRAAATAAARVCTPSFAKMFSRCCRTVCGDAGGSRVRIPPPSPLTETACLSGFWLPGLLRAEPDFASAYTTPFAAVGYCFGNECGGHLDRQWKHRSLSRALRRWLALKVRRRVPRSMRGLLRGRAGGRAQPCPQRGCEPPRRRNRGREGAALQASGNRRS
jgi:hypothetical protein